MKMNLLKPTMQKLTILISLVLISNEVIPEGWKYIDNFNENSKNQKKNYKTQNQKKILKPIKTRKK